MKRYDPIIAVSELGEVAVMDEDPDGEYYSRADLIAAGVLVPVPDGEACRYLKCETPTMLLDSDLVAHDDNGHCVYLLKQEDITMISANRRVQPVRLVKLEDVG